MGNRPENTPWERQATISSWPTRVWKRWTFLLGAVSRWRYCSGTSRRGKSRPWQSAPRRDLDVKGKRVLVRVDFNVPIEQGVEAIASYDHRLKATLPTIQYLIQRNSRVVLCSHLGRPKGQAVEALRMSPVADRLSGLLSRPVKSLKECIGPRVEGALQRMSDGDIVMLENLRYHPGEEGNDPEFARALASLAEVYVMDAFAVAHRAHASTVGVPRYLPSAAGLLVQMELEVMGKALEAPARPLAALLGGAKVTDKIVVLENLLNKVDKLFIGGGMAATFLKAQGHPTGTRPSRRIGSSSRRNF